MGTIKSMLFLSAILVLIMSSAAIASRTAPLVNYENVEINGQSGKILSLDDISKAVTIAAVEKNWKLSDVKPGQAKATLVVRNKHTITVEITYTEKTLSIKYKDSINMNYDPAYKDYSSNKNEVGSPAYGSATTNVYEVIHPNYNLWVGNLLKAVQHELLRMK